MAVDIKEDPEHPEALIFNTKFLHKGSYSVSEFEPEMVVEWQEGVAIEVAAHGDPRPDGWSTFDIPLGMR